LIVLLTLTVAFLGCGDGGHQQQSTHAQQDDSHAGHDHGPGEGHDHPAAKAATSVKSGKVVETMDAGSYTYVHVDCGDGETIWAAAPQRAIAAGTAVNISTVMPMENFHSETLDRTFDVVYFVNDFGDGQPAGHGGSMGAAAGEHPATAPAADVDLTGIEKAKGGKTVAEVWEHRQALAGGEVVVRGKVVKYNSGIMGRNWIHIRDGSGGPGTNDLTVTSNGFAQVGDLVVVTGTVAVDKDFGAGYRYDVIVENATILKSQ
jgi:hypothetical protein